MQTFVEILDKYFGNVCELDLIFNFHKVFFNTFRPISFWISYLLMDILVNLTKISLINNYRYRKISLMRNKKKEAKNDFESLM
jgi:hypothetical protein